MAAHKFSSTFVLGLSKIFQKLSVTATVTQTANRDIEQPTIEINSKAFL